MRISPSTVDKASLPLPDAAHAADASPQPSPVEQQSGIPLPSGNSMRRHLQSITPHSLAQAAGKTKRIPGKDMQMRALLGMTPANYTAAFGTLKDHKLKYVETVLTERNFADNLYENTTPIWKGVVQFKNYFSGSVWVMTSNCRDPGLAAFHMNEVVKLQIKSAEVKNDVEFLVQRHVLAEDTQRFFEKYAFSNNDVMSPEQFDEFINTISTGKSSKRILQDHEKVPVDARVIISGNGSPPSVVLRTQAAPPSKKQTVEPNF